MKTGLGQQSLSGEVRKVTDGAILFVTDTGTEFWVPRKVCLDGDSVDEGDTDICVAVWWFEKEGIDP